MKLKLLLISIFILNVAIAQVNKPLPTKQQWETYFFEKKAAIQTKLYNLALQGKIKAYYNDSLAGYYSIEDLKKKGRKEVVVALLDNESGYLYDSVYFEPFNPKDILSIWYLKKLEYNQSTQIETNQLKCLSLGYKLKIGGIEIMEIPLFWLSISDLKSNLSKDEFDWLMLMYYYVKNDNTIRFIENNDDTAYDRFWEINQNTNNILIHKTDSLFFKKLSTSLYLSHFYIHDFCYYSSFRYLHTPYIFDLQQKKMINLIQFEEKYNLELIIPIQDNNGDYLKDSMIKTPHVIDKIESVEWNVKSQKIENLLFYIPNGIEKSSFKFSIPIYIMKNENMLPKNFWFFEDYYRFKP